MKAVEKIMSEDSRESLQKHIAELEAEKSCLKASATESAETINMLQRSVNSGIEDYNLLQEGNKSLLAEHDELRYRSEDLESELARVRSSAAEDIIALKSRIRSAEAHNMEVAAVSEKHLSDFKGELIEDLVGLHTLYECSIQSIGGLCLSMPKSEPSVMDYIRWLSLEVTGLPEVFAGVNKNFISAMVEGTLVMAEDSVDLATW
jgi:chromosome segregation ATPase